MLHRAEMPRPAHILTPLAALLLAACWDDSPAAHPDHAENGSDAGAVAMFEDPATGMRFSEVNDIDRETMRFENGDLVWVATGDRFADWDVHDNQLVRFGTPAFEIRFGDDDGTRRAFFTEIDPPTICDVSIENGSLSIRPTSERVP